MSKASWNAVGTVHEMSPLRVVYPPSAKSSVRHLFFQLGRAGHPELQISAAPTSAREQAASPEPWVAIVEFTQFQKHGLFLCPSLKELQVHKSLMDLVVYGISRGFTREMEIALWLFANQEPCLFVLT